MEESKVNIDDLSCQMEESRQLLRGYLSMQNEDLLRRTELFIQLDKIACDLVKNEAAILSRIKQKNLKPNQKNLL